MELRPELTCVDGVERVALVVEREGEIVAVGRYERLSDRTVGEVGVVVADEFQHFGIGTVLLQQLALQALRVGITRLKAELPGEDTAMLSIFYSAGYPVSESSDGDVVELTLWIGPQTSMEPLSDVQPGRWQ
jgi:GNAT superfamily N-acetyltransferase